MRGMRLVRFIPTPLLQAVPVVLGVVVLNFLLLQLAPGDAATVLAGEAAGVGQSDAAYCGRPWAERGTASKTVVRS